MPSVPFQISDESGKTEIHGLLFVEETFLVFDLQVRKWGLFKQAPEKVKAELGVIDTIRLVPGLFKDSLYIVPRRTELLRAIPGTHKGELRLKVAKRYREQARRLVAEVMAARPQVRPA